MVADDTKCSEIQTNYASSEFRAQRYEGFMITQSELCPINSTDQCMLNSDQPTDSSAFNARSCNQGSVSQYYIEVHSADHIQAAFNFSARTGIKLSIKNSGHDYLGRSSLKGSLALWMRKWGGISRDNTFVAEGCYVKEVLDTINTGPGVNFGEAYKFTDEQGVTLIGGYASTVGVTGGWVQAGGHSVLSPVYGLGIDRVVQYKIVTPDGKLRVANSCQNSDLFWALRGGGAGTFGIVIEATHRVEPQIEFSVASIKYNQTKENVNEWLEILVNSSLRWSEEGWGGHLLGNSLINVTPLLNLSSAKTSMDIASNFALANNGTVVIETSPSWYAFYTKYVVPNQAGVGAARILNSRLVPASFFSTPEDRRKLLSFLNDILEAGLSPYIPYTTPYLYPWVEGSTSATTAWRGSPWHLSFGVVWKWNSTVEERKSKLALASKLSAILDGMIPGAGSYFNEANPWTKNWKENWWGKENYEKLLKIKHKYDPRGLLSCWKCVGFDEDSADRDFPCLEGVGK